MTANPHKTSEVPSEDAVYISYANADRHFVARLAHDLTGAGLTVYFDSTILKVGDRWAETLQQWLTRAASVIVVLSEAAVSSSDVRAEIEYARKQGKPVLPVMLDDVYNSLGDLGLAGIYAPRVDVSETYDNILADIASRLTSDFTLITQDLRERGFTPQAVAAFTQTSRRMNLLPNTNLVFHYDRDLTLQDMLAVENAVNQMARYILTTLANPNPNDPTNNYSDLHLYQLHTVRRPGSTEIELALRSIQEFAASPLGQSIISGALSGIIVAYAGAISKMIGRGIVMLGKKLSKGKLKEVEIPVPNEPPPDVLSAMQAHAEVVLQGRRPEPGTTVVSQGYVIAMTDSMIVISEQIAASAPASRFPQQSYLGQLANVVQDYRRSD